MENQANNKLDTTYGRRTRDRRY